MTTTPAPTEIDTLDLDAIRKLARTVQDWAEHGHPNDPNWDGARLLIKGVPLLLDELATARRDVEGLTRTAADLIKQVSNAGEAVSAWTGRTKDAREERDAARKELAKTRAELDVALPFLRDGALAEHHSKCGEASQWDIRRCEDADCLERAHLLEARGLIPQEWDTYTIPDANPATTAEPADEPFDCAPECRCQTTNAEPAAG